MRSVAQASATVPEPGGHEAVTSMFGEQSLDGGLVGLGRGRGKGERNFAETEFEHPIAAAGLAVIVALRRSPAQKLDLPIIEAEAAVDRRDLRLDRALVRQEQPRRTALDDGRRDRAEPSMSESDWVAKMTDAFFLRSVFSHSRSWPAKSSSSSASQPSSTMSKVGRPSRRSPMRWKR